MSADRQPLDILLEDMRRRLAQGGLTYREAVLLDDIVTTIGASVQAADNLETVPNAPHDASRRIGFGNIRRS